MQKSGNYKFTIFNSYRNAIEFPARISAGVLPDFGAALHQWNLRGQTDRLILDFSNVEKAFANGMLGIIAMIADLRAKGFQIDYIPPASATARDFFAATKWSGFLNPEIQRPEKIYRKHFIQQFNSFEELPDLVNNFMDIIIRHIEMPRDILTALEWSVNEICDNVINHSNSVAGGFVQVIAYPAKDIIAFTVADAGRGIFNSLKEGIKDLPGDVEAIEEAIKVGVTRNKEVGQGNGLAGNLRITEMTGGSLDIISNGGRVLFLPDKINRITNPADKKITGTCVSSQINISQDFSVVQALTFGAIPYTIYNIADAKYEMPDADALYIAMRDEKAGTGTRAAGKEMHTKVVNLMKAKPGYPIIINWESIEVIASSFADEFIGKLFVKIGEKEFDSYIKNTNLMPLVSQLIDKAITERNAQGL